MDVLFSQGNVGDVLDLSMDFYGVLGGQPFGGMVLPGMIVMASPSMRAGRHAPINWTFSPSWPRLRARRTRRRYAT